MVCWPSPAAAGDGIAHGQTAESRNQPSKRQLEEVEVPTTIKEDPQAEDTPVSVIELPELKVIGDLSSSSEDGQCARSSPEELPLQVSVDESQTAESRNQPSKRQLEEVEVPTTIKEDLQAEDTPVSAIELPELSVVDDLSSSSEDRQSAQSETGSISPTISTAAPVSSPEELPLQDSVDESQTAERSVGKSQLEEVEVPTTIKEDPPTKDIPASFLGQRAKPLARSTSLPKKPFFIRDEKYEDTRESLSQLAWDTVIDDWY